VAQQLCEDVRIVAPIAQSLSCNLVDELLFGLERREGVDRLEFLPKCRVGLDPGQMDKPGLTSYENKPVLCQEYRVFQEARPVARVVTPENRRIQELMWEKSGNQGKQTAEMILNRTMQAQRMAYLVYRQLLERGYRPTQPQSNFTRSS